jgi:hypothetical protein
MSTPRFTDLSKVVEEMEKDMAGIFIRNNCVVMNWKGHDYEVPLNRVKSWASLTDWMIHLCGKGWINPYRLKLFAETVIAVKGWSRANA